MSDLNFPLWLSSENTVRDFFVLLGFSVASVSIHGRQIDVIAHRFDNFSGEKHIYVIEVTTERVGVDKGSRDGQKLLVARTEHPDARLMLISTQGFTDDQEKTLSKLGIVPKRLYELEATLLPLRRYALNMTQDLRRSIAPDIGYHPEYYVEPELEIRDSVIGNFVKSSEWIDAALSRPEAGICAVLGSLGTGKTSLLKRFAEVGIARFLSNPDLMPLPVYVPLGRYKQHAGDLDQMLMAELKQSGIENYPSSYIRFLLENRRIIVLLDGLDEVHPIQNSDDILETVTNILSGVGKNASGIISCRKQFFESSAEEQAYFGSFTAGKLRNLNHSLQKILSGRTSTYIATIQPFTANKIKEYLDRRCAMDAAQVDDLLSRYYGFIDMATTPVLLAMIATTVAEGMLDAETSKLFPHVGLYAAYTTRWIQRDLGRARLSTTQRMHFSEHLADRMLWEAKESVTWSELSQILRSNPEWGNNPLTNEEAELDIRNSGFLIREMDDRWRFVHRSIMEYFAACAELTRLNLGERPRHLPSDGYALFLTELLAADWAKDGNSPIPDRSWHMSRGEDVRLHQLSLLASASRLMPPGTQGKLSNVPKLQVAEGYDWNSVDFHRVEVILNSGQTSFRDCSFVNSSLTTCCSTQASSIFRECRFSRTELHYDQFPAWTTAMDATNPRAVDVSVAVWEFSRLATSGAKVFVQEEEWVLRSDELQIFLECSSRLKGKVYTHNFLKGAFSNELTSFLPALIQKNIIEEDASRQTHQLSLSTKGRLLATQIRTNPMVGQAEIAQLFRS